MSYEQWAAEQDKTPRVLFDGTKTTYSEVMRAVTESRAKLVRETVLETTASGERVLSSIAAGLAIDGPDFDERQEIPNGGAKYTTTDGICQRRALFYTSADVMGRFFPAAFAQ